MQEFILSSLNRHYIWAFVLVKENKTVPVAKNKVMKAGRSCGGIAS
jgi:hypothetical protein